MTLRFLFAECCPDVMLHRLLEDGHDCVSAKKICHAQPDAVLVNHALDLDRLLVTEDRGIGNFVTSFQGVKPSLVIIALPTLTPPERADRLADLVATSDHS